MRAARFGAVLLSASFLVAIAGPVAAAGTGPVLPLPHSIAAVGDSITQAASSGGILGADYPQNSWSTGTNTSVNSHYLRLLALGAPIAGQNFNRSVSGAKMSDINGQIAGLVAIQPEYLTIEIGGNDLCTSSEAAMTPVSTFRSQFQQAMATLTAGSPNTNVFVASIPRALGLWELFRNDFFARFIWSIGGICQSLLANPTSTNQADVDRRARVGQRNIDYNQVLAEVCAATPRCLFDGNAVYNTSFTSGDVAGDYFHPSTQGQAKLAAVSWAAGYTWSNEPPNQAPTASFSVSCTDLSCSFTDTSTDGDGTIETRSWNFGDGGMSSAAAPTHTYTSAGTFTVGLTVTDDDGAPAATSQNVTVTAPPTAGTVTVANLAGAATRTRNQWTARVTIQVVDGSAAPVAGATVTGAWSTGGQGSCVTVSTGTCSVSSANLNAKKIPSTTFTVSGVAHGSDTYVPGATSVTVARP
jgi:PKD repeat protein